MTVSIVSPPLPVVWQQARREFSYMRGSCRGRCRNGTGWTDTCQKPRWKPSNWIFVFASKERSAGSMICSARLPGARARGLTRRVWPLLANAIVGREHSYDDDDIGWVLGQAGWHIIEAGEDGQAVYQLAHQALTDNYHGKFDEQETQTRIVTALTHGVAGAGWLDCDHYLWRHLADHA